MATPWVCFPGWKVGRLQDLVNFRPKSASRLLATFDPPMRSRRMLEDLPTFLPPKSASYVGKCYIQTSGITPNRKNLWRELRRLSRLGGGTPKVFSRKVADRWVGKDHSYGKPTVDHSTAWWFGSSQLTNIFQRGWNHQPDSYEKPTVDHSSFAQI